MTNKITYSEIIKKPNSQDVVNSLLSLEKEQKKRKIHYNFEQLIGTWSLFFVTGTQKAKKRAGIILGQGKYLPSLVKINLSYSQDFRVENKVKLGFIELILTGPVKFLNKQNILVFDFTKIEIKLVGKIIYSSYIKNGEEKEKNFAQESIKKQAFFNYFLVENKLIAARGRGGGLAIWIKD